MRTLTPDGQHGLSDDGAGNDIGPAATLFTLAFVAVAQFLNAKFQCLLDIVIGVQVAQIHWILAIDVVDKVFMVFGQLVDADHDIGRLARPVIVLAAQGFLDSLASLPAIDDLHILQLHLIVRFLEGVIVELIANHSNAVIVKIEVFRLCRIKQCRVDRRVHPVGMQAQITADIPLQQPVAMLIEQSLDFMDRHAAYQYPHVVHIFHDGLSAQHQRRIHLFAALENTDQCIVVEVHEFHLVAPILVGSIDPALGNIIPALTVVAQDHPDAWNISIADQRADFLDAGSNALIQGEFARRVKQHLYRLQRFLDTVFREMGIALQTSLVFALKNSHGELTIIHITNVQSIHTSIVTPIGHQICCIFQWKVQAGGHAQQHKRGRFLLGLVTCRQPVRMLDHNGTDALVNNAGVDVHDLLHIQ